MLPGPEEAIIRLYHPLAFITAYRKPAHSGNQAVHP